MHKWEVRSGVGNRVEESRVLEGKKRIREMIDGLGDTIRGGKGDEDVKTAIVLGGGGEVKPRVLCLAHDFRCVGESCAMRSWPGGWMGWAEKSKGIE